jgi:hypothetical protein
MKLLISATWLSVSAAAAAHATPTLCPSTLSCLHGAPAPSIGSGVSVALAQRRFVRHDAREALAAVQSEPWVRRFNRVFPNISGACLYRPGQFASMRVVP